ncbi:MAG: tRNA lysidine(34) synthetase TilS [Clostridia bacterium]|nr:tRNA lysidine(34) synthetase TilS [Clostridia bacterium]
MSDIIFEKIKQANEKYSLFPERAKILVALSGGADSVTLLLALKEYFPELELFACHVNHMLRAEEADRDSLFAKELCGRLGIPIEILKTDVAKAAKEKSLSTELCAREIRYGFFEKVCKKYGITLVATAHTASDCAETVLFNLARGSTLPGLCGIPPKRNLCDGIEIIRPLIFVSRDEIEEYLNERNEKYVTDSTNLSDGYTRNFVRHNVVPLMKKVNPSFENTIKNTCVSLRSAYDFIDKYAKDNLTDDVERLKDFDDCILNQIIVKLYKKSTNSSLIENVHVEKIASAVKDGNLSKQTCEICLPGKISAFVSGGKLYFDKTVRDKEKPAPYCEKLSCGINFTENKRFAVVLSDGKNVVSDAELVKALENYKLFDSADLNLQKIDAGALIMRSRLPGDSIRTCKMTKRLKSLLSEKEFTQDLRDSLPLICAEDGIIYVPGVCVRDGYKGKSEPCLNIRVYSLSTL